MRILGKRICNYILLIYFFVFAAFAYAEKPVSGKSLIEVSVGELEAFSAQDYASTERYKSAFEAATFYALGENNKRLAGCGYRLRIIPAYFTKSNPFLIREEVRSLVNKKVWITIGPTRSNHLITAVKFLGADASSNPIVGLMTQSDSVAELKPPFFTTAPGVDVLANAAFKAVEKEQYGKRYGVLVNSLCLECEDFVKAFDKSAVTNGYQKFFQFEEISDTPDLTQVEDAIIKHTIDFLVIPNYSKMTGHIIATLHQKFPHLKYVGGSGWGQTSWSFIPGFNLPNNVEGISARVGVGQAEMDDQYHIYSFRRDWHDGNANPPFLSYAVIEFFRGLTDDLCKVQPKNREQFLTYLKQQSPQHFRTKAKIGIFKFKEGQVQFAYEEPK